MARVTTDWNDSSDGGLGAARGFPHARFFFKVLRWIQLPATFCLVLAATVGMSYVAVIGVAIPSLRA